ncbi:MAG: secretin and TonB N-terminal domain-containing protein [Desulfocapsaceae bacterium]|nr:secretin and TonB N-terminal domain-containing protein [Desulfocapsaceae bacterium]
MYTRLTTTFLTIFSIVCLTLTIMASPVLAAPGGTYMVTAINTDIQSDGFVMTISGEDVPVYTVTERFDPFRVIVDVAGVEFSEAVELDKILPANKFATLKIAELSDRQPAVGRFEFAVAENIVYDVKLAGNNLQISLNAQPEAAGTPASPATDKVAESVFAEPAQKVSMLNPEEQKKADEMQKLKDSFSFSGYNNERISVDFYKIDLHNVFRLFRQITDLNIIVDEAVNGSITLALTDVPWDFALDIILNLADLKKEERYNTIVIYPKDKEFLWPQRAVDNLSFEADVEVVQEEALIIEQSTNQPAEIMQAKELLLKGSRLEKKDDYEEAVDLYEKAYTLWPENTRISNRIANLYLGRLNLNAKAFHYAQKTLQNDPADTKAALYCAIAAANMDKTAEATEYFSQSVSDMPPMKEALVSFAAFSENNNQKDVALKLLDTYSSNYGDTLHIMVSKARIYDSIGEKDKATAQYRALLTSGFQMRPDLRQYVQDRVSAE